MIYALNSFNFFLYKFDHFYIEPIKYIWNNIDDAEVIKTAYVSTNSCIYVSFWNIQLWINFLIDRVVTSKLGGGIKHLYHWIDWIRDGPTEDVPPIKEKVIQIMKCGCRTPNIALVGVGGYMKYIVATANMKAGDILCTSRYIPPNAGNYT